MQVLRSTKTATARALAGAMLAIAIGFPVAAASANLDPVPGEILIRFEEETDATTRMGLAQSYGARIVKENATLGYHKLQLEAFERTADRPLTGAEREAGIEAARNVAFGLGQAAGVRWAEPNGHYGTFGAPQDEYLVDLPGLPENQWGAFRTGLFDLWRYGSGGDPSIEIAIIDSGIDDFSSPHPDLAPNVLETGYDTVDDDPDPTDLGAFAGHGTHVAGIAAAADDGDGMAGVAFNARILVVRALDCTAFAECPGTFEDIADGVQLAADYGADVINMSLGGPDPSNLVREAIQYAIQKSAIVVVASGNDGQPTLSYPAALPEVIAVGATEPDDDVASFSNWGDELDVVAPGVDIYSTFPGDTWVERNGTSMAAPFVSGIAALVVAENPAITQLEMEAYLREHTVPLAGANADRDGYGRVDFFRLSDWSDAPPPYPAAEHRNFAWEWLGEDASPEPSISDPLDADFIPNVGAPNAADGFDDGVFRGSVFTLPILPPRLGGGPEHFDVTMGVSDHAGPRYGPTSDQSLHLDIWADWDGDGAFESGAATEHIVTDAIFDPSGWGTDQFGSVLPISVVDEHIYGNPVVVRSRLAYGASAGSASGSVATGEVEDDVFINFVEDFDVDAHTHTPGLYTIMDGWDNPPDPTPWCGNHGTGRVAATAHPAGGDACNGIIERVNLLVAPDMDWTEYTAAFVSFWYCHQIFDDCMGSEPVDRCRVRLDRSGVKIDLGPIPLGSGILTFDVSDLVGSDVVRVEIVEETDYWGHIAIDDLVIWAYDGEDPIATTNLSATRPAGSNVLDLDWTATDENLFIPSPPAEPTANIYEFRYSSDPIVGEPEWIGARPLRPRDVSGGISPPGIPGAAEAVSFRLPSAFQSYHVADRIQDETTNRSAVSNSAAVTNAPSLSVAVAGTAPVNGSAGETVDVEFQITNTGDVRDSYGLTAADTQGYDLLGLPGYLVLDPSTSSLVTVQVEISSAAADTVDTLTVTATSLSDPLVAGMGSEEIVVDGVSDVDPPVAVLRPALRLAGAHPFRDRLDFAVELPDQSLATVSIYQSDGRRVRNLVDGSLPAGSHRLAWDGRDENGRDVGSGVYFLTARAGSWEEKIQVLRVR